jgi:hypothetical protein
MLARGFFVDEPTAVELALAGSPWGEGAISIRFGTAAVQATGLHAQQVEHVARVYGSLARDHSPALHVVEVRLLRATGFKHIDTRGWQNTMALEHEAGAVVVVGRDFAARVDLVARRAVVATPHTDELFLAPFENTLRVLAAYEALRRGGVLLHCAGLVDEGGARICFGPSGVGKSTVSGTWVERGRGILSDELCAVELERAAHGVRYVAEQLPFAGDVAARKLTDARLPLLGLYRLAQGDRVHLEPMGRAAATAALCACAPFVNADPFRLPLLLQSLEAIATRHPVRRLALTLGADPREAFAQ